MKKIFVLIFVLLLTLVVIVGSRQKNEAVEEGVIEIKIGQTIIKAELADTEEKRGLGLSGRPALPADRGLLFVFDQPGKYGFWMKDMNFPIDIVWLDAEKKIIGTTKNLSPDSYPQTFFPPQDISYALEINTGILP